MNEQDRQQINSLIVQIAQGNVLALEDLSRLVSGRMLSVAMSFVKNRSLAEDVVQDSFVKILNNAYLFVPNTNGYSWICKIVQNVALNTLRHEKRFQSENIDDFFDIAAGDDVFSISSAAVTLKQAMSVLTDDEKKIIYQKYFMDYTVRDIAKSLGKSKSTVQRAVTAAEEKMKKFIDDGTN